MNSMYNYTVLLSVYLAFMTAGCKPRSDSSIKELSSGAAGSGDSSKNCEELLYEIERYQPKFNEAFKGYTAYQCDLEALSKETKGAVPVGVVGPPKDGQHNDHYLGFGLTDDATVFEGVGMQPDPSYVKLVDPFNAEKTRQCQQQKKYLEEKTLQLASLKSEAGSKCSPQRIKAYTEGKREYIIVDHPTCGYFSRCDDTFSETNKVKCTRCWLDTYQNNFLGASTQRDDGERSKASTYKSLSGLTCSNESAARDAIELFCNNIRPGSCSGPNDKKIVCEDAPARDYNYGKGQQTLSGGIYKDWDGTDQSYTFTTKFGKSFDTNISAGARADAKVVEVNTSLKTGMTVTHNRDWNMNMKVKSEVGLFTLTPPAMIKRGGIEEGALNTKFSCGIEVLESSWDSERSGVRTYLDLSVEVKGKLSDPTGITNSEVSVGTSGSAGVNVGFENVSTTGKNKYRAYQSMYLTAAGMTREGMQAACDRYNAENMNIIMSQFLSSSYAKFHVWEPKNDTCRTDRDCTSGNGWIGRCRVGSGETIGKCNLYGGHGTQCPTQMFSNRACDKTLGCKLVSWMSFLSLNFNKKYECRSCSKGKGSDGYCNENI